MKKLLLFLIMLTIYGCNKPKTVLICGDHICINKAEAEQYFEDNLTLEVKIIDKKAKKNIDLVELNLKSNSEGKREISVLNKDQTRKKLKVLSNDEIERKKAELKKRKKNKNKEIKREARLKKSMRRSIWSKEAAIKGKIIVNKPGEEIIDICTIVKKCSIEEISKYLVKQGKKRKFPDITSRETK